MSTDNKKPELDAHLHIRCTRDEVVQWTMDAAYEQRRDKPNLSRYVRSTLRKKSDIVRKLRELDQV